ncbi:MAG: hypothetical protein E7162_02860 [Firmicutes bacterium]|nr:hypothetical protein [Bacillota bacterium]
MKINLVSCLFVLDTESSNNIRKNDNKKLKLLVKNNNTLPSINYDDGSGLKGFIKNYISSIINSDIFHLEQVFALGDKKYFNDSIDIVFLSVTNIENINNLSSEYKLIDFSISNNSLIKFGNNMYEYKTVERFSDRNVDYVHNIYVDDVSIEKTLLEILVSYKRLRTMLDSSDIMFKFMPKEFTLEDVRIVYELVKDKQVDKSNFRKRIIKYVEKCNDKVDNKGYRPTQLYRFKPLVDDIWL